MCTNLSSISYGFNRLLCGEAGVRGLSSVAVAASMDPSFIAARDILLKSHFETVLGRCDGIESMRELSAKVAITLLR